MQKFLVLWIIFQLVGIGFFGGNIAYEVNNGIYQCTKAEKERRGYIVVGALFPLIFFTEEIKKCEDF